MSARSALLIFALGLVTVSCSEKSAPVKAETVAEQTESAPQPREDEIAEDCVAFVRATKLAPKAASADCPGCAAEGAEVLAFRQMKIERISCGADSCQVSATVRAVFNRELSGTITGGLTAWISPEQRLEYSKGHAPEDEQIYRVKIIYKRTAEVWRAIEFDKAD